MTTTYKQVILTEMPAEMRAALVAEAEERDVSRNEVAVSILCAAYGVKRDERRSTFRPIPESDGPVTFEVPAALRSKLRVTAARRNATMAGLIRQALAEHYGLPVEEPTRKPRSASAPRTKETVE